MWRRRATPPPTAIPFAEHGVLRTGVRRASILRVALATLLLGLLVGAVAVSARRDARETLLAPGGTGIVLLDLSASVSGATYRRIASVLDNVADEERPIGLVGFSDISYELLPPGTPARELRSFVRLFQPIGGSADAFDERFPPNPWATNFRAGTKISDALFTAQEIVRRDGIERASVLLVSDLDAPQSDVAPIRDAVGQLAQEGVELRILPLFPQPQNRRVFEEIAGEDVFVAADLPEAETGSRRSSAPLPWTFLLFGAALALALAANERLCGRLTLPRIGEAR